NFAGRTSNCCGPFFADPSSQLPGLDFTTTEIAPYYNEALDRYFISGSQPDIDALESGRIPGWRSTGQWFEAASTPTDYWVGPGVIRTVPVCRFYIPPGSHFFSAFADECNMIARERPEYILETMAAFHVVLPNVVTG